MIMPPKMEVAVMHAFKAISSSVERSSIPNTNAITHVAFIGNSLPRRCGIATFTTDLHRALSVADTGVDARIIAMTDHGCTYDYPAAVSSQIADAEISDYVRAAADLNTSGCEVVSLQHEFGIFGGADGSHILALLSRLTMPVVTTLHTVLATPSADQRHVLGQVCKYSSKLVVMAEKGRDLLRDVYSVPIEKIEVVPHGIPDVPFAEPDEAKARRGFSGRTVILTFGLLSPSKGIEVMIDAMPEILKCRPDAVYVVLGATHPNLVRDHGEAYRDSLAARVKEREVENQVIFLNEFVDKASLLDYISMCDLYVTPYLNEAQMTSGTLAYSFGFGRAVVSTPYWHARELLADGRGVLVPFGDATSTGREIAALLADDTRLQTLRARAYVLSRSMTWERTAARYMEIFAAARQGWIPPAPRRLPKPATGAFAAYTESVRPDLGDECSTGFSLAVPDMRMNHFLAMCDDTGLLQHAIHSIPDRTHGYCIDDNARALLLACVVNRHDAQCVPEILIGRFAGFIAHAWNPDNGRFRNFMSFDRRWLEDTGSEDSHGRALWALGQCARHDLSPSRRIWASSLFRQAFPALSDFGSPRAWAFALLGLNSYCESAPDDTDASRVRSVLAGRLLELLGVVESPGWVWFENGLSYDNARLPQALIETGLATGCDAYIRAGLRALRWLMRHQTTIGGLYRPVGTEGFKDQRRQPRAFDQQPLEASATVSACLAAWRADGDGGWRADALRAFAWFHGENDLTLPLVDADTGSCRDGLHPDRANENRGGESVVSYLLALSEIRQLRKADWDGGQWPGTAVAGAGGHDPILTNRGPIAASTISQSAGTLFATGPRAGASTAFQTGDRTAGHESD